MKAKLYIILFFLCVLCACNKPEQNTLHLQCYSLDYFDKKVLNNPYDVYYNTDYFLVQDGKDTIYFQAIDSISKPKITSNEHGLTFIEQKLHYTKYGKYVSENALCTIDYSQTLITGTDTIIGYEFRDFNLGQKHHIFKCKKPMGIEQYKAFVNWIVTHQ